MGNPKSEQLQLRKFQEKQKWNAFDFLDPARMERKGMIQQRQFQRQQKRLKRNPLLESFNPNPPV